MTQQQAFAQEIETLSKGRKERNISRSSRFSALNPFLAKQVLLRVDGRLKNATLAYN